MEIFNYLRPSKDIEPWMDLAIHRRNFRRVALVCRFFFSVMLPWMFESIKLADIEQTASASFCRSIINGCGSAQIIATYIKRCSFSDRDDLSSSWYKIEFQKLYSAALALMPNVEELSLSGICISKYLLRSMIKLKRLTSLSLHYCPFGKVKDESIRKLSLLRLKSLRFFQGVGLPHMRNDLLFTSFICLDSLLTLHTNSVSFVARIAEQDCHLPLQELDLDEVLDVGLLPKVFQKIPALKKLRIFETGISQYDIQFHNDVLSALEELRCPSFLPVLEELCCPSFLSRSLVPGRPISSLQFITIDTWSEIIDATHSLFKPSIARIRSLSVPSKVCQEVCKHFPNLISLRVEFTEGHQPSCKQSFKKVFATYFLIKSGTNSMHMYSIFQISVTPGLAIH